MERVPYAVLDIRCPVPSKKNLLRPTGTRERSVRRTPLVYKKGVREQMTAIEGYIMLGWSKRKGSKAALVHPDVTVEMFVSDVLQDRDGIWTTILDCMKKAGVIVDDSIKYFNGTVSQVPAVTGQPEFRAIVTMFERG